MRSSCLKLLLLSFTFAYAASGQTNIAGVVGQGTADRALDAQGSGFEVQAGSDATTATIKASKVISSKLFNEFQFSASAPLSKGSDTTTVAAASGFPNAFTVTGKLVGFRFATRTPDFSETERICRVMRTAAMARGLTHEEAEALECDSGKVSEYAPQLLPEFLAHFFDTTKEHYMWGGSATVGHRVFEYLQVSDQEKVSATRTPWGVSAFVGMIPGDTAMLVAAGLEYRDRYKDGDSVTICPPADSSAVQCKTGPLDEPKKERQKLAFVEVRRLVLNRAVSLKVAYDFETSRPSADLPVYLIRTASGGLSGGVRVGWEKDKETQFGVFVSGTFSLFPF